MIPAPYGGKLVNGYVDTAHADSWKEEFEETTVLNSPVDCVYDADKIACGAYSPLQGFMNESEYSSVIGNSRLPGGLPWTMPIVFLPLGNQEQKLNSLKPGDTAGIRGLDGEPFALVKVEEKYVIDKGEFAQKVYGTKDPAHPNVADLAGTGETAVAGRVTCVGKLRVPSGDYELTPTQTRKYFERMGWRNVAAYQARNPPHTAHEYIQRLSLEREDVDALMIQPVVGKLKKGDYKTEVIMRAYARFVENYYPKDTVLLSSLSIAMRYAGPKAVLFYAIVRRNYGCSHYIVGRDQAGVGSYYDPYACHRIFDEFDVGVKPLRYRESFYCKVCGWMASSKVCPHPQSEHVNTSQTRIRSLLAEGKPLPPEILRPEVADVLRQGEVIND